MIIDLATSWPYLVFALWLAYRHGRGMQLRQDADLVERTVGDVRRSREGEDQPFTRRTSGTSTQNDGRRPAAAD